MKCWMLNFGCWMETKYLEGDQFNASTPAFNI
jgi:hypothetical protein